MSLRRDQQRHTMMLLILAIILSSLLQGVGATISPRKTVEAESMMSTQVRYVVCRAYARCVFEGTLVLASRCSALFKTLRNLQTDDCNPSAIKNKRLRRSWKRRISYPSHFGAEPIQHRGERLWPPKATRRPGPPDLEKCRAASLGLLFAASQTTG